MIKAYCCSMHVHWEIEVLFWISMSLMTQCDWNIVWHKMHLVRCPRVSHKKRLISLDCTTEACCPQPSLILTSMKSLASFIEQVTKAHAHKYSCTTLFMRYVFDMVLMATPACAQARTYTTRSSLLFPYLVWKTAALAHTKATIQSASEQAIV